MLVREAHSGDLETIVDFQLKMAKETEDITLDREILTRGVETVLSNQSIARYFIAEIEGISAGMLMITYEWSDWRDGWVWWIQSVYTHKDYRKQGVYRELYGHIKKIAESDSKIRGIRLYVDNRNSRAQEVYRQLGMNGDHYTTFEWMKG